MSREAHVPFYERPGAQLPRPTHRSEVGAKHVGIIQSLLATCRLHGLNPYIYLVDVLQRIALHPDSRVEELTPRRWKALFADDPLPSDLELLTRRRQDSAGPASPRAIAANA